MAVPLLSAPSTFAFVPSLPVDPARLHAGEVAVRVVAGGICGSDVPFFRGAPVPPYAAAGSPPVGFPMHEIVGDIVAVGVGVDLPVGTRVVGWAKGFDGLADEVVTSAASLAVCPDGWAPDEAVLIQPLACVLYAVERLGDVRGAHCAVIGLGPIGLLFCHVLRDRGARLVTGVDRVDRRDVAADFGIDSLHWASSGQWASGLADDDRPAVIVEAVGHQVSTLQHALSAVAPSGSVFYFGVNDDAFYPLDMGLMVRKNITLTAGGTLDRRRVLTEAAAYLGRYPQLVKQIVTHRFDRADVQRAYEVAASPAPGRLKVVVTAP